MECRVLRADDQDHYTWDAELASQYKVVRYDYLSPALFVPIDGRNRQLLGLSGAQRKFKGYAPYQDVALALFRRFGNLAHGLSWESFHRGQPGRVYAIWHHQKPRSRSSPPSRRPTAALIKTTGGTNFLPSTSTSNLWTEELLDSCGAMVVPTGPVDVRAGRRRAF